MTQTQPVVPAAGASPNQMNAIEFNIHGLVWMTVDHRAPAVHQLADMFACFRSKEEPHGLPDLFVSEPMEKGDSLSHLEDEYAYDEHMLVLRGARAQVVADGSRYRLHGSSELLTSSLPLIDRLTVTKGAAMFHAATVEYRGVGIALPAAGGTGKTSTIAKLMRREGFGFMGDDWAFLSSDGELLGFAKPMFIKPHHRSIYPHLFEGMRKPLVPRRLSRPIGRLTTVVHPYVIRYPRVAATTRRWSPEHRMVMPTTALPENRITTRAPLALTVYVERYDAATVRLRKTSPQWMASRMLGNFHIELPSHSQVMFNAMGATSLLPLEQHFAEKSEVLYKALSSVPTYLLQVPANMSADLASDSIVRELDGLLSEHALS